MSLSQVVKNQRDPLAEMQRLRRVASLLLKVKDLLSSQDKSQPLQTKYLFYCLPPNFDSLFMFHTSSLEVTLYSRDLGHVSRKTR